HLLSQRHNPSRPGNSTRSVMFAWSSLSRTSHFKEAGRTTRRQQSGWVLSQASSDVRALDSRENRAYWFTIRSSSEGGSNRARKTSAASRSKADKVGATRFSISTVSKSEPSARSRFLSLRGRKRLVFR